MKNKCMKIFGLTVIILLLSSPIISSISNLQKSIISSEELVISDDTNAKIEAAIQMVDENLLREFLTVLSVEIGPRMTGTYGTEEAAEYIHGKFSEWGLETRYQYWRDIPDRLPTKLYIDKNVEATLEGVGENSDEVIVFNAHYDTVKVSPGAVDDGTGTVGVMLAAYVLSHFEFNRTIKFVTFSGEEVGLLGSRRYVREQYNKNTDIFLEFNADMIGYANTAEEGRTAYISQSEDADWASNEIKSVNEKYGIFTNLYPAWNMTAEGMRHGSDYFDFIVHGYECVAFWQSGRGGEYFHTPNDTIDKVNFSYLANMTKLIIASIAHLADIESYYPNVRIGAPERGRLYREDRTYKIFRYEHTIVFDDVLVCAKVRKGDAPIESVAFYYDGKMMFNDTAEPYQWRLNKLSLGMRDIKVILYDELGRTSSDEYSFRYINLLRKK